MLSALSEKDFLRCGLSNPDSLTSLSVRDWDLVIRQGRSAAVLGKLQALLEERNLLDAVPLGPRNYLEGARVVAASQERVIRWEVHCIERALMPVRTDFVLLKGAAYVLSELPFAHGRIQSDVDILVPKLKLKAVETALLNRGWIHLKLDKYDQRFYRQYSHEIPPLYHPDRATVLDVHHNILPILGRLHPDAEKLLALAETIPGTKYKRLYAPDMVLHAAAHTFQSGDMVRGLRELSDIDGLLRTFCSNAGFFDDLLERARLLDLKRPLFYALRYSKHFLGTPIPDEALSKSLAWAPPQPVLHVMDTLIQRALVPFQVVPSPGSARARWLLYVRSHWLALPPFRLARHLLHQSLRKNSKE